VRPPLPGSKREGARKLAGDVWRWFGLSGTPAAPTAAQPGAVAAEDAAARIDAARERLRSTIAAPKDERAE
jgi:hypothetical protein